MYKLCKQTLLVSFTIYKKIKIITVLSKTCNVVLGVYCKGLLYI